jgi:multidrug transporter EmrE-like cation transporter
VKKSKILGVILIVAGVIALVYGNFSYTRETHEAKIGPVELTVKDKENVEVPTWAGIASIVAGSVLLLL